MNDSGLPGSRRGFMKLAGAGAGAIALASVAPAALATVVNAAEVPLPSFRPTPFRVGKWLPSDQVALDRWLADLIHRVDSTRAKQPLHPTVEDLRVLIESDARVYMWFSAMFSQVPQTPGFSRTPIGTPQVRDYPQMLRLVNAILTTAPEYNETGLVGFPINAILNWSMATEAGYAAFLDPAVNAAFKNILNAWGDFLTTPESRYVLSRDPRRGWFGADARKAMPNFDTSFICDPSAPFHGFTSWDDFFTRKFRSGQRPIGAPNDPSVIINACESAPYRLAKNLKRVERFWIKGQPYSLRHIFTDDPVNEQFVGGTLYQAFLSALSYHRWHMPVDGTIKSVRNVDGTYYSEAPVMGWDPAAPNESQGYITELAARAVVTIEADDPRIGLMAFVAVGMAEVSSCEVTAKVGQHLSKGEDLGMFHFGGSTHCLIFRPGVRLDFNLRGQQPGLNSTNIPVNAALAQVK
ncbi:MAG: phosphatidylserine decarboxylase family protein [Candidatus Nanopelagicales bacterium]